MAAFAASSSDAVLVHRGVVEYLNEVIAAHGDGKVATLVAIKDFKTGIYDLQWETAKLAMESEDLVEKIRELQMTRAPQNLLQDILVEPTAAKPPSASAAALDGDAVNKAAKTDAVANRRKNEMASLEARLDRAKTLHARRVEEKRREVAKARNQAAKIAARNEEIMAKVAEMDAATRDVAKLRRVSDAARAAGPRGGGGRTRGGGQGEVDARDRDGDQSAAHREVAGGGDGRDEGGARARAPAHVPELRRAHGPSAAAGHPGREAKAMKTSSGNATRATTRPKCSL